MRTIKASCCILEPQLAMHAKEMFVVLSDPAIYEFENGPPVSEQWLATRYARLETRRSPDGSERWLNWVIRLSTDQLAGYVQATVLPDGTSLVAYEINSQYWRKSIGTTAVHSVLGELRDFYGVHTFIAVLKQRNYRSEGLLRKLGFTQASGDLAARFADESDELVMVRECSGLSTKLGGRDRG